MVSFTTCVLSCPNTKHFNHSNTNKYGIMAEIAKLKRERASAKSLFTKAYNRLSEATNIDSDVDLIEAKFATVKAKWSNVQLKHETYIIAAFQKVKVMRESVGLVSWKRNLR